MKTEEFNKIVGEIKAEQEELFTKATELYIHGEYNIQKYKDIGAHEHSYWSLKKGFLSKFEVTSESIDRYDINDLSEYLDEFRNGYKQIKEIGLSNIESDYDVDDGYMIFVGFKYSYYELNEENLLYEIGRLTREKIKHILKPDNIKDVVIPDCKIVQLFRDGAIDWKTLQQITYKDCEI